MNDKIRYRDLPEADRRVVDAAKKLLVIMLFTLLEDEILVKAILEKGHGAQGNPATVNIPTVGGIHTHETPLQSRYGAKP